MSCVSYQGEALGRRRPPLHSGEWPLLNHVFGPLVHSHHRLFGDPQEPRHKLVLTLHLFLQKQQQSFQTLQTGTAIKHKSTQINKYWIKLDHILKRSFSKLNFIIGWKWPLTTHYLGTAKVSETETGLNCQHWTGVNLQSLARNGTFSLVQSSSTIVHLISSILDFRVSMYTFQSLKLYITVVWYL